MANFRFYKFADMQAAEIFLNGGLLGTGIQTLPQGAAGFTGLVGRTLTFTAPAGSCTFVAGAWDPAGVLLLFKEVKAQIEAALTPALIKVTQVRGSIAFAHPTFASAIVISGLAGPLEAAQFFGFDADGLSSGKKFGPPDPPVVPHLISVLPSLDNSILVVTNE
jgi:hypothetical protein